MFHVQKYMIFHMLSEDDSLTQQKVPGSWLKRKEDRSDSLTNRKRQLMDSPTTDATRSCGADLNGRRFVCRQTVTVLHFRPVHSAFNHINLDEDPLDLVEPTSEAPGSVGSRPILLLQESGGSCLSSELSTPAHRCSFLPKVVCRVFSPSLFGSPFLVAVTQEFFFFSFFPGGTSSRTSKGGFCHISSLAAPNQKGGKYYALFFGARR